MNEPLYEDRVVRASLAKDAATHGHILVQPQRPAAQLSDLSPEESSHLFLVASYVAAILFQGLRAEGTNIIINEEEERLTAHVIARRSDDNLSFTWQPAKFDQATVDEAAERIRDKAFPIGKRAKAEKPVEEPKRGPEERPPGLKKDDAVIQAEAKEDYLVKQLIRIP